MLQTNLCQQSLHTSHTGRLHVVCLFICRDVRLRSFKDASKLALLLQGATDVGATDECNGSCFAKGAPKQELLIVEVLAMSARCEEGCADWQACWYSRACALRHCNELTALPYALIHCVLDEIDFVDSSCKLEASMELWVGHILKGLGRDSVKRKGAVRTAFVMLQYTSSKVEFIV